MCNVRHIRDKMMGIGDGCQRNGFGMAERRKKKPATSDAQQFLESSIICGIDEFLQLIALDIVIRQIHVRFVRMKGVCGKKHCRHIRLRPVKANLFTLSMLAAINNSACSRITKNLRILGVICKMANQFRMESKVIPCINKQCQLRP